MAKRVKYIVAGTGHNFSNSQFRYWNGANWAAKEDAKQFGSREEARAEMETAKIEWPYGVLKA